MQKTFVERPEIKLVGIYARTNNRNEMGALDGKIFPCVRRYFHEALFNQIENRVKPGTTFSAFTDYESDHTGDYTFVMGEEVSEFPETLPTGFCKVTIPAQKYAKFTNGPDSMPNVILDVWKAVWVMDDHTLGGKRRYATDFEIYDERAADHSNIIVDVFVGLEEYR